MAEDKPAKVDTAKLKKPNEKLDPATPIGDQAEADAKAIVADKYDEFDENTEFPPLEAAKSYDEDVQFALERETQDGKGDDEVPDSDFVSFATDDVEKED